MGDMMTLPATVEEFMEQYKMTDTEHVYSNGTEFVPIYRMKQWFEHCRHQQRPTIDAVPVVRCRECKHGELDFLADNGTTHIECYKCIHPTTGLKIMEPDDFCSYGERKEGADDEAY